MEVPMAQPVRRPRPRGRSRSAPVAGVIERNIEALVDRRQREEAEKTLEQRIAHAISGYVGRMSFIYAHLLLLALWVSINLGWIPVIHRFDPNFVILATVAAVEAIFLAAFILI